MCGGLGTLPYAAPEILKTFGKTAQPLASPASDMWALGVTFHQILAATCQAETLFLPDITSVIGISDVTQRNAAVHGLLQAELQTWVSRQCLIFI